MSENGRIGANLLVPNKFPDFGGAKIVPGSKMENWKLEESREQSFCFLGAQKVKFCISLKNVSQKFVLPRRRLALFHPVE